MFQGDIYWVTLNKPDKRRPVLILTRTSAISDLNAVVVAAITTTVREIDSQVMIGPEEGVREDCVVNLDNIHTINKRNFGSHITHLSSAKMEEVFAAVQFAFGFDK